MSNSGRRSGHVGELHGLRVVLSRQNFGIRERPVGNGHLADALTVQMVRYESNGLSGAEQ